MAISPGDCPKQIPCITTEILFDAFVKRIACRLEEFVFDIFQ